MKQDIIITGIRVGEHSVPVPHGLSELVNRANAWSTSKPDFSGYNRQVVRKNGKLVTIITKED